MRECLCILFVPSSPLSYILVELCNDFLCLALLSFFLFYLKNRISNRLIIWLSSEIFITSCEDSQDHL
jgi:hypothetical protein